MADIRVQTEDFDLGVEMQDFRLQAGDCGAMVSFSGLVREFGDSEDIKAMTLSHYPGMTEKALEKIANQAIKRWSLNHAVIIHRVGRLEAGDQIVLVITASAHRKAAFESAQFIMDYLKTEAPFWKKEHTVQGDIWVEAKISDEEEKLKFLAQTLDMPPPWSPKIYIDKDKYLKGTLLGEETTFFIKMKV